MRHGGVFLAPAVLVVQRAPCPLLGEQWVGFYLDAPALVVGQVPVHLVQFIQGHEVEGLLQLIGGEEMSRTVYH